MNQSEILFATAKQHMPSGVSSPVRAFKGVDGTAPIFFKKAQGAYLTDVDDRQYIDYVGSWGPAILGHAHPAVIKAVQVAVEQGLSFGAPCEAETQLAAKIRAHMPSMDLIRFVNSGTEATMSAIRLARGYTHRDKILKFEGCYHGHADSLLIKAGSGGLTFGVPSSKGVPAAIAQDTYNAIYNDLDSVQRIFEQQGHEIACVILEPVAGNMNCILPVPGFLEGLRAICTHYGSLLIFDEVMTGFRVALNGAQGFYQITPDLSTLGKVIGGGLPVGAYGGRADIMAHLAPEGPVYQAGTLSGNPIAMVAGLANLAELEKPLFYETLSEKTKALCAGLEACGQKANIPISVNSLGGLFGFFFTDQKPVTTFAQATQCDIALFKAFFHGMLKEGIYFAPSAYEAGFMSQAHTHEDIQKTLVAAEKVLQAIGEETNFY